MARHRLQLSLQLVTAKPTPPLEDRTNGASTARSQYRGLRHLLQEQLDLIVDQVRRDGFHVEHLASLMQGAVEDESETIAALCRWCRARDLRISINHLHGICFFESQHAFPSGKPL